jgi:hypothetical protein
MNRVRDLEESLRKILKEQVRELVRRSAPVQGAIDREELSSLIEQMINAWVESDARTRKDVLRVWLGRIRTRIAEVRAVKAARAGTPLISSPRSIRHLARKIIAHAAGNREIVDKLGFDLLYSKLSKKSTNSASGRVILDESSSKEIAKRLKLSQSDLEGLRQKLRSTGLDIAFVTGGLHRGTAKPASKPSTGSRSHYN